MQLRTVNSGYQVNPSFSQLCLGKSGHAETETKVTTANHEKSNSKKQKLKLNFHRELIEREPESKFRSRTILSAILTLDSNRDHLLMPTSYPRVITCLRGNHLQTKQFGTMKQKNKLIKQQFKICICPLHSQCKLGGSTKVKQTQSAHSLVLEGVPQLRDDGRTTGLRLVIF